MGKANRLKSEKAENTLAFSTNKKNNKKGMPTWLGTAIVITVLVAVVLTAAFFALNSAGVFNRMRVVLATDHYDVTVPMMSYAIYAEYQEQVATYDSYSEQWGVTVSMPTGKGGAQLDKNKPLRDQYYATQDENGLTLEQPQTWFDYFANKTIEKLTEKLSVCEAALANGVKLEQADEESIDMTIQTLELYASYYGYTTNGYIAAMYGDGVNEDDVRDMLEIEALYYKYKDQRAEEFTNGVTDDQVLAEYNGNVAKYDVFVDYIGYTFTAKFTASTNKDAATAKEENEKNAAKYEAKKEKYRALLAELEEAAKTSPSTYKDKLLEVLKELFFEEEKEAALAKKAEGATLTADEEAACRTTADKNAADAVANAVVKNADSSSSSMDSKFKTWVTNKNEPRKSGDVFTNVSNRDAFNQDVTNKENETTTANKDYANSTSTFTVYLLTSGLKRNDGTLRSVAHILFKADTFKDSKTGEALTSSASFSGTMKTLTDRVLAKHSKLSSELMAAELLALMIEEGKLVEKTVDGKTFYEMDETVFETYGKQYTEDSSVNYDNVKQGQMVKSFENWMFDSTRVKGEVSYPAAVETEYGHHIMLYRGDEKDAWSYQIRVSLAEGQYDAWLEETIESTEFVKSNLDNLDRIAG